MPQKDLVCSKCVGRRTVNNIMMKVNSKVMVTTVPPDQPLAYTRRPIFVSASVHTEYDCASTVNKVKARHSLTSSEIIFAGRISLHGVR
jgi:hypothetical protein